MLLGGEGPDGIAVIRLRPALWSEGLDAHLEELYVAPDLRGQGIGRALLEGAMDAAREAGAVRIDLGTSVDDTAAIGLYELRIHQPRGRARRPADASTSAISERPRSHDRRTAGRSRAVSPRRAG